jgi:uncharacterized protein YjiS (DUF1127 family)
MSTQTDTVSATSALPDDRFALVARARAMQSAYIRELVMTAIGGVRAWFEHRRTLAAIEQLSPHVLADIGVDASALRQGQLRRLDSDLTSLPRGGVDMADVRRMTRATTVGEPANSDLRSAA